MSWIDDDKDELGRQQQSAAELRARESIIAAESGTIYEDLWNEIVERIEEAANKGMSRLLTNGSSYQRKIIVPQKVKPGQEYSNPKEYVLNLSKNQQAVTLTGPDLKLTLPLVLGEDKVVRLRHDGEEKIVKDVARSLLRPLLFPDLYGQK
jgi:cobalamin biosynthesis Co2+ chelatase CbiK